jgi:hypothetical protein
MKCVLSVAVVSSGAFASQLRGQEDRHASFRADVIGDAPGYDAASYGSQCDKINDQCEERIARRIREYEEDLAELAAEYETQKNALAEKEARHKDEKEDVAPEQKDVKQAHAEVKEKAHCPPELKDAEARLAVLEAQPNKTPKDVDEECELKKKILELKPCVAALRAAEKVLATEKEHLKIESAQESDAASAVPPQKAKTTEAEEAYKSFKKMGVRGIPQIKDECQAERDALERKADADIEELESEYGTQKVNLGEKVDTHKDEKADVDPQKQRVLKEQKDVAAAKEQVEEHEHCPPELETAQARLQVLEGTPNKTPKDVDEECELKKKILELKACVEKLKAAQAVLKTETEQYHVENKALGEETAQESKAASAVPPQQRTVADLKSALAAAKEARKSICHGPDDKPAPAPAPAPAPKEKSGAERAAVTTTVLAVFAVFLASMQA